MHDLTPIQQLTVYTVDSAATLGLAYTLTTLVKPIVDMTVKNQMLHDYLIRLLAVAWGIAIVVAATVIVERPSAATILLAVIAGINGGLAAIGVKHAPQRPATTSDAGPTPETPAPSALATITPAGAIMLPLVDPAHVPHETVAAVVAAAANATATAPVERTPGFVN